MRWCPLAGESVLRHALLAIRGWSSLGMCYMLYVTSHFLAFSRRWVVLGVCTTCSQRLLLLRYHISTAFIKSYKSILFSSASCVLVFTWYMELCVLCSGDLRELCAWVQVIYGRCVFVLKWSTAAVCLCSGDLQELCNCFQVIYGSYIEDNLDQQTLSAMVDYWVSPNACKKDFEIPKCKDFAPMQKYFLWRDILVRVLVDQVLSCCWHKFRQNS